MQTKLLLSDSWVGKYLQKLSFPRLAEFLILASIFLFWYEGFFVKTGLSIFTGLLPSILLVFALLFSDKSKVKIAKSTVYLIFFFLLALFSGVLAVWNGINPKLLLMGWLLFAQFLVAILVGQGIASPKRLLRNIMLVSIPMIAVGVYQFLANQGTSTIWVSAAETDISTRAFAFFGSPNVLGAVLAVIALVSASLYVESKDKFMAFMSVTSTIVLIFTFSRSAWMGLVAGAIFILLVKNWKWALLSPLALVTLIFPQIRERLLVVFTPGYWMDSSLDGRLWAINNGFHIWAKYPLFGSGPGTYGGRLALNYASPIYLQGIQGGYVALYFTDNQWLQLLVQTGLFGIVLFALFAVNMLVELVIKYNKEKSWLSLGVAGAFVAFLVAGFFGNVLEFGAIAVPMGIMLGVANSDK